MEDRCPECGKQMSEDAPDTKQDSTCECRHELSVSDDENAADTQNSGRKFNPMILVIIFIILLLIMLVVGYIFTKMRYCS